MGNIALLAGATDLVGNHCLKQLLEDDDFESIKIITRKPMNIVHHKLIEITVDFDELEDYRLQMEATHTFCALGTTIKKAGSQAAFRKVDYEYPLKLAKVVHSMGCTSFTIVTAIGANPYSFIFYNKVKGEVERELSKIGFKSLHIIQPSLLMGERPEARFGEEMAQKFFSLTQPLFIGPLKKVAAIEGAQVAKAMIHFAKQGKPDTNRYPSDVLQTV
jgi:uncharacterized protein YbjT (DUF2867 family)